METIDFDRLVYLTVLVVAIGISVLASRPRLRDHLKPMLTWVGIFGVVTLGAGVWMSITSQNHLGVARTTASGDVIIPVRPDGHFETLLEINGQMIPFMIDTGASEMVLTKRDAEKLGFDLSKLVFMGAAQTANGIVTSAPVRLETVRLGPFHDTNVRATVNGGELFSSLLGMTYLRRFGSIEITPEAMILRR